MFRVTHGHLPIGDAEIPPAPSPSAAAPANVVEWLRHRVISDLLLAWAERYRRWLLGGLLCVYIAGFNGHWRMSPDAGLFLSLGRNLAQGRGYTYLGQDHNLVYPGWPWLIAATFKLFGHGSLVPVHVLSLLIAIAALALIYRLFLLHCGRATAVVVTMGVGMTKTFYTFAFELWTDLPFAFGVLAFLAGWEGLFPRKRADAPAARCAPWLDIVMLVGGLVVAGLTRPTIWPLLLAVIGSIIYAVLRGRLRHQRIAGAVLLGSIVVAACLLLARRSALRELNGEYERFAWMQAAHLGETLSQAGKEHVRDLLMSAAPDTLFQVRFGRFNLLPGVLVVGLGISLFRERVLWGLWFCALLATIVVVLPLDRYFLPVIPLLVFAWWQMLVWINHRLGPPWGNLAFAGLIVFAMGMNGSKVGGVIIQQRARPFLEHYSHGEYAAVPALAREIQERIDADAMVLIRPPYARVTEFLSDRFVVSRFSPSMEQLVVREIARRRVFVVEPADADIQTLLRRRGLAVGERMWSSPTDAGTGSARNPLHLHETRPADEAGAPR